MRMALSHIQLRKGDWAVRFFWLTLVAIHVAPLASVARHCAAGVTPELIAKLGGILLSIAFFGSKALNVRILRFPCKVTGVVAFLVVVGLVHQQVREEIVPQTAIPLVAVLSAAAALPTTLRRRAIRPSFPGAAGKSPLAVLLMSAWRRLEEFDPLQRELVLGRTCTVPRGPPAI